MPFAVSWTIYISEDKTSIKRRFYKGGGLLLGIILKRFVVIEPIHDSGVFLGIQFHLQQKIFVKLLWKQ